MTDELDDIYEDEELEEEYEEECEDTRCDYERYPLNYRFYEDGRFL